MAEDYGSKAKAASATLMMVGGAIVAGGVEIPSIAYAEHILTRPQVIAGVMCLVVGIALFLAGFTWETTRQRVGVKIGSFVEGVSRYSVYWISGLGLVLALTAVLLVWPTRNYGPAISAIRADLNCWGKPRHLTPAQAATITAYARKFPPQEIGFRVAKNDTEAGQLAVDIGNALHEAGWKIRAYDYVSDIQQGLNIQFALTPEHEQEENEDGVNPKRLNPKNPDVRVLLNHAMELAHMPFQGGGGLGVQPNATKDLVQIAVGSRLRDGASGPYCAQIESVERLVAPQQE